MRGMPKWIWMLLTLFIISSLIIPFLYIEIEKGKFHKWSHVSLDVEMIKDLDIYLGYNMEWEGRGNPTLTSMQLIRENGEVFESTDSLEIELFVASKDNQTGSINAEYVISEGLIHEYKEVEGFKVNEPFKLIVHAQFHKPVPDDLSELKINFTSFGLKRTQTIAFEGLISEKE